MYINVIGPQGRPLTINPVHVNYIHMTPEKLSLGLYGKPTHGMFLKDPTTITTFVNQILANSYFLDLRTNNDGTILNMASIKEVDYVEGQNIYVYFSLESKINIAWQFKTQIETALANFVYSIGGGGTGARWMRRRRI